MKNPNRIRNNLRLPIATVSDRLTIRLVDSEEELRAALELLHDVYVDSGFMESQANRLRLNIYQALPTTLVAIAILDDVVIGTVSVIADSPFRLPTDSIFSLSEIRSRFDHVSEISGLAVHPEFRGDNGKIMYLLIKYAHLLSMDFVNSECSIISINPKHRDLYDHIFFYHEISPKCVDEYQFVKGAPALGRFLNLTTMKSVYRDMYGTEPDWRKNLFQFLFKIHHSQLVFPVIKDSIYTKPLLSPEFLNKLFVKETDLIDALPVDSVRSFLRIYLHETYDGLLSNHKKQFSDLTEQQPRFSVQQAALLQRKGESISFSVTIENISESGMCVCLPFQNRLGSDIKCVSFCSESGQGIQVPVSLAWQNENRCGFLINGHDDNWFSFVQSVSKHSLRTSIAS